MNSKQLPFQLLIVEDCPADVDLLKLFLSQSPIPMEIQCLTNGSDASDYLFKRGSYDKAIDPDLIVMDQNLPRKDGQTLVKELKNSADMCRVPIIMLSTSNNVEDVTTAYCMGVSAFISKPLDVTHFRETILAAINFWFCHAELATRSRSPRRAF